MKLRKLVPLLLLVAVALAACTSEPEATEHTIFVGPQLVDCVGVGPQKCMQVKENPEDGYTLFYDQIDGFTFEEGYEYELVVREEQVENPPADGSSINWVLVEELSKTPAAEASEGEAEAPGTEGTEAPAPGGRNVVTVEVGPELVECEGEGPQTCMLVRQQGDEEYGLFYDQIEGFEFEPGYEYVLTVRVDQVDNPPAGGSSLKYTLVEEVSRTPATETGEVTADGLTLEGPLWGLESYRMADGTAQEALPDAEVTAQFADGRVAGNGGCNAYNGSAEVDGNSLVIGPIASTLAMCVPQELADQEATYLALLQSTATYEIVDGQLLLSDADGNVVLTYAPIEAVTLEGTLWVMTGYNNGQEAVVSAALDTEVTAQFVDGLLSGSGGCNNYSGGYELDGNNIAIGPLISTSMFCSEPAEVMDQESAYLAAVQLAATYEIVSDRLDLYDAQGARLATYVAVSEADMTTLEDTMWIMTGYNNGLEAVVSAVIDTEVTAQFVDGLLSGSGGCNNYSGGYELDGNNISIGQLISTQMFCAEPEGTMDQESQYLAAIQLAATYAIEGDRMELFDAGGARLATYVAAPEVEAVPLVGATWALTSIHSADAVSSLLNGSEITATFGEDGQVVGSAGCNNYFGGYVVDGDQITVGPLGSTRMACNQPEGVMEQETDYLSLLDEAASYSIEGNVLTLLDANGAALLSFTAVE